MAAARWRLIRSLGSSLRVVSAVRSHSSGSAPYGIVRPTMYHEMGQEGILWKAEVGATVRHFSTSGDLHTVLQMPALSPTMNQGNIVKWRKKEGDKIDVGDVICEIETDKATLEFESLEEGYLAKILAPEGSKDVNVGQPIAITVEDADDIGKVPNDIIGTPKTESTRSTDDLPHGDVKNQQTAKKTNFSRISPSAKLLIANYGLDAAALKASGPRHTLLKGDVLAAIKSLAASSSGRTSAQRGTPSSQSSQLPVEEPPPQRKGSSLLDATHEDFPNSQIRKVIAKRLLESKKNTPHVYLSSDAVLDPLLALRQQLKEQHGIKVSVNDIMVKAVALTLRSVPEANAYWSHEKGEVSLCDSVDISIAVATEKGLMTPIIRNADQKTLSAISVEIKELAEKARAGKLAPNQFQGGTFSISNLGMFPVDHFCAIINPPQSCILAVGRANKVVDHVVGDDGKFIFILLACCGAFRDGSHQPQLVYPSPDTFKLTTVTKIKFTLSGDHRVIDGRVGGTFLTTLSSNLSEINRLLL
ncbi:unnamed protein product [Victoria cruziana]